MQAFYYTNSYYARLVSRGFTEQAGNFQAHNVTGHGKGGDPIVVLASSSAARYDRSHDQANFEDLNRMCRDGAFGAEPASVFLTALILGLMGVALTAAGTRATFRKLGLDVYETLLWLGLAELPTPPTSRRR